MNQFTLICSAGSKKTLPNPSQQRCFDSIPKRREAVGLTAISGTFHFGGLPHEMALKNIRLFADKVLPQLK